MRPLFTIHAGEFLVGEALEKLSIDNKKIKVWIPSKDTGVDFLASDDDMSKFVSIQVKYSRDFNETNNKGVIKEGYKASGWWTLSLNDIANTKADYWIFVLYQIHNKQFDFIIVPKANLFTIYNNLNNGKNRFHSYITINKADKVFETRGLNKGNTLKVANDTFQDSDRDLTVYLNNWDSILQNL